MSKQSLKRILIVSGLSVLLSGMASASALAQSQGPSQADPPMCVLREEATTERTCHADRVADVVAGNPPGPQSDGPAQTGTAGSGASAADAGTGGIASGDGGATPSGSGKTKGGRRGDNGVGNGGGDGSPNGRDDSGQ